MTPEAETGGGIYQPRDAKDRRHHQRLEEAGRAPQRQHGPLTPQFGACSLRTERYVCSLSPEFVAVRAALGKQ